MKIPLHKSHKGLWSHNRIVMVLVCILIALMYLQGEHYVHCRCIHPDVLMDLQCSMSPCLSKDEQTIYFESRVNVQFFSLVDTQIFSIYDVYTAMPSFFPESLRDPNKILHILQRYNSWNSISILFCSLVPMIAVPFFSILFMNNGAREKTALWVSPKRQIRETSFFNVNPQAVLS